MNKNQNFIYCFTFILVLLFGGCKCNRSGKQAELANIEIACMNCASEKITVELITPDDILKTDSIVLDKNGNGMLRLSPENEKIILLRFQNNDFIPLIINKNDHIKVTADCSDIRKSFIAEGNDEVQELTFYFRRLYRDMNTNDSLGNLLRIYKETPDFSNLQNNIIAQYEALYNTHKQFASDLIMTFPKNLANLLIINQYIGNQRIFNIQNDTILYYGIDRGLMQNFPENPHAIKFHETVAAHKQALAIKQLASQRLSKGNKAPDFSLPNISGKLINLSDFQGKIVLLSFWGTWEKGTPNNLEILKTMYRDYKNKDVEFIAISMDKDDAVWKNAVKKQNAGWTNASDLKGETSPLIKMYNLPEKLPVYYLIGNDGIILAQNPSMMEIDEILYQATK